MVVPRATVRPPGIVGRDLELQRVEAFAAEVGAPGRSLVLVGDAGIGKTTLWEHGVARCRAAHAQVLVTRPSEDDRDSPAQGLHDLFDRHPAYPDLARDRPVVERSRWVLDQLRTLAAHGPVVVAVDDLPWLDDITWRTLRFALRRLRDEPVSLLATARTWSPERLAAPAPGLDGVELLDLPRLEAVSLRRIVTAAAPTLSLPVAAQVGDLAHGNPFFALELARAHRLGTTVTPDGSPLAALGHRVARLPAGTLRLVRLLALAGPSPLRVLAAAGDLDNIDDAVRPGLEADVVALERDDVLRFTHPLIATAVLAGMHALDRRALHAALARAVTEPDARAVHLAGAAEGVDAAAADEIEAAALRLARRGAPRVAADLLADSVRLTAPGDAEASVRRTVAEMMQRATAGDLPTAVGIADALLARLDPGPLRAAVVTGRVVLEFTNAEAILRAALDDVPGDESDDTARLRGRLLALLGWLLAIHLGRVEEGLGHAQAALDIGRSLDDAVLVAQAASAVSTASLLLGRRADGLIDEAVARGAEVVQSQLALWPRVLRGRQQLWDGYLGPARADLEQMHRTAMSNGAEFQRSYRLSDLALVALAAGDLASAAQHVEDGTEAALDCGDERAMAWLAYPAGLLAALRGCDTARAHADRLDSWAGRVGERPRHAMAGHVRGVLATAHGRWSDALQELLRALSALDSLGYAHPGAVPVLPQAIHAACQAGDADSVEHLRDRLHRQSAALRSPWADAGLLAATGQLMLLRDDPASLDTLGRAHDRLADLGYRLDAARVGAFVLAAALRTGRRQVVRDLGGRCLATFEAAGVRGWDDVVRAHLDRVRGASDDGLTPTEAEIAALVADGLRNREIAVRMFVSESTVEAHLTRTYRKLGLRNRAELSRRVERSGVSAGVSPL
ncbi:helix-turn-helix transcriptional regulator [Cellulomonas fengjieae]|uniref:helix-turn-helix transcriptional regulator n=1 Tax=Cellulomonas fengjieae TaxID=2819978 RepID=UPI001AAF6E8E|nr:LuxR family transcriptional regulator [Cellulomonas fengjieae]MBO3101489.1 AAA family ATPase [Cellulomonas fengjieae]